VNPDTDPDPAFQVDPDPRFDDQNLKKNNSSKIVLIFFGSKIAINLFLGLHKGHPNYRRSLQP
jgi:hypothetical protein